jgi:hypothetical protein
MLFVNFFLWLRPDGKDSTKNDQIPLFEQPDTAQNERAPASG